MCAGRYSECSQGRQRCGLSLGRKCHSKYADCVCVCLLRVFPELLCHFRFGSEENALCFARHNKFYLPSIVHWLGAGRGDLCLVALPLHKGASI